ncbi:class I SAM-dependent methyltransferase [Streptomonospora litoralis]|uniref:Methyltransferase domain-containing protein n=1 Tax=Streptomonospora litoralis TaxID=2498135 RepID=A0A4P6Q653_9ACTN|nr:class I SAM-dependent methyltransferase [Streptomonospora litoralis]QBI54861.1 hypothetical protein EKD16_15435 [Streptomonospora litoralis]
MPAEHGPLLDAGAGGGWGTRLATRTLPEAHVLALEPSPVLRAVLLSRAAADADCDRVTVGGDDLLSARLPERLGGAPLANLIGHFSPEERDRLRGLLAARLAPGAFAMVNLAEPVEPALVERTRMTDLRIGLRTYTGWAEASPAGPDRITWRMTYEVHEGERLIGRDEVAYTWWTLTGDGLRSEAGRHGLAVAPHGPADAGLFLVGPDVGA